MAVAVAVVTLVGAQPASAATQIFEIYNANYDKCVGVNPSNYAIIYRCTGNGDQNWHVGAELGTTGYRQWINSSGKCLALFAGVVTEGNKVVIATCSGPSTTDQYWSVGFIGGTTPNCPQNPNPLYFINYKAAQANGLTGDSVLSTFAGSSADGNSLILYRPVTHLDQCWVPS